MSYATERVCHLDSRDVIIFPPNIRKVIEEKEYTCIILENDPNDVRYIVRKDSKAEVMSSSKFNSYYVPKFGKYEIERYVGNQLLDALNGKNTDITELLNTIFTASRRLGGVSLIDAEYTKEVILSCFKQIPNGDNISLEFKWEKAN